MKLIFSPTAWEHYLFWQKTDKTKLKRINELMKSCKRTPFDGIGKPEALKGNLTSYWSRRIDSEHRFVYSVDSNYITITSCRFHYS